MADSRSFFAVFADWLAVRQPTRLVVDGLAVLASAGVVYALWSVWAERFAQAPSATQTSGDRVIGLLFSGGHFALYHLGLVMIAVGCVRLLAEAIRGSGGGSNEGGSQRNASV